MKITKRDIEIMGWILEQKVMTRKQIRKIFWKDIADKSIEDYRRLSELKKEGYLKTSKREIYKENLYLVTGKGVAQLRAFSRNRGLGELSDADLGLHAKAQGDFLKFIEERLAAKCQVIYSTHSPFMVQPGKLERVRIVEDRGRDDGSVITSDVLTTDADTLFPLQGALGYDLVQNLFIAPHNLVVEGVSDYTYLTILSDYLKEKGGKGLDERWSTLPVGSADLIPTFVALLGSHLDVTVLVDSRKAGHQKLSHLASQGFLKEKRIVTIGDVLKRKLSDIEDVFTVEDYLLLYNEAFGKSLAVDDIKGTDPIVNRIARHEKVDRFDHGKPSMVLLKNRCELLPKLSKSTLERFETLIDTLNATLPKS